MKKSFLVKVVQIKIFVLIPCEIFLLSELLSRESLQ